MADGSIDFKTDLDNADLEKKLKQAEKSIESLKRKIEGEQDKQTFIEKDMERARQNIAATEKSIDVLQDKMAGIREGMASGEVSEGMGNAQLTAYQNVVDETNAKLAKQNAELEKLEGQWQKSNDRVEVYKEKLASVEATERELGAQAQAAAARSQGAFARASEGIRARFAAAAQGVRSNMANVASSAAAPWEAFGQRVSRVMKKVFLFSVVLAGLRAIKGAISDMIGENEQFKESVANLKAVLGGFLAAAVSAVMPALTAFVNTLAGIFQRIASLIDMIFGSDISGFIAQQQAAAAAANSGAGALEDQAAAAGDLADEQKEANRQLMSFDEINAMSSDSDQSASGSGGGGGGGGSPLAGIVDDFGIFKGLLDWMDGIWGRIANDAEGPFARIRDGLGLIKKGWGELVQGIMSGDWELAWEGVKNIIVGALYVVEGAFGAFMDWLDEITGGRFSGVFQGMEQIVHGFVEVVEGLLRGDFALVIKGVTDMVDGAAMVIDGVVDGVIGLAKDAVNGLFGWLSDKFPELAPIFETAKTAFTAVLDGISAVLHGVVDGARQFIEGAFEFVVGLLTLDGEKIKSGFEKMGSGVISVFKGLWDGILSIFSPLVNWFAQNVMNPLENAFNSAWNAIVSAAGSAWSGIMGVFSSVGSFFASVFGGAWEYVKGVFSSGGQMFNGIVNGVVDAFKSLANNVIGGLNWAIAQPFSGINGIIRALRGWQVLGIYPFSGFYEIPVPEIPYLAKGAVIPPNREFMAVLGDQRSGNNIEAPESLIRQIVAEETGRQLLTAMQAMQQGQQGDVTLVLQVGNEELARASAKGQASLARRGRLKPRIEFA